MKKERKYKHLSYNDRLIIERMLLQKKFSKKDIADAIGCSVRTIYYEIKRATYEHTNSDLTTEERYCPEGAEKRYREYLSQKGRAPSLKDASKLKDYITYMIKKQKYSPEAVLFTIEEAGLSFDLRIKSVNTIYEGIRRGYLPGISLEELPRRGRAKERRKYVKVQKRATKGVSIEKRPKVVQKRSQFGDWEMDSVVGKITNRKTILVLTERKTRFEILEPMKAHTSGEVIKALNRIEKRYGSSFFKIFRSITVDNGTEFSDNYGMEKALYRVGRRTNVYYCHPYSSHERGSNENNNLLVRRFYPKGADFDKILNKKRIKEVEEWMNFYPRRIFGGRCSYDLFCKELQKLGCENVI